MFEYGNEFKYQRFIYTERIHTQIFSSLPLINVKIKLDSLWSHLEAMSLLRQYKQH